MLKVYEIELKSLVYWKDSLSAWDLLRYCIDKEFSIPYKQKDFKLAMSKDGFFVGLLEEKSEVVIKNMLLKNNPIIAIINEKEFKVLDELAFGQFLNSLGITTLD